jgi:flagellar biosynthesis anti-sigma factor FlgM
MKIDGTNPLIGLNKDVQRLDAPQQSERTQSERAQCSGESSVSDRLELSVRSREITHLQELIQSAPDVRESKIEQIRGSIERGTYNVKAEKIAEKIIGGSLLDEVF